MRLMGIRRRRNRGIERRLCRGDRLLVCRNLRLSLVYFCAALGNDELNGTGSIVARRSLSATVWLSVTLTVMFRPLTCGATATRSERT